MSKALIEEVAAMQVEKPAFVLRRSNPTTTTCYENQDERETTAIIHKQTIINLTFWSFATSWKSGRSFQHHVDSILCEDGVGLTILHALEVGEKHLFDIRVERCPPRESIQFIKWILVGLNAWLEENPPAAGRFKRCENIKMHQILARLSLASITSRMSSRRQRRWPPTQHTLSWIASSC